MTAAQMRNLQITEGETNAETCAETDAETRSDVRVFTAKVCGKCGVSKPAEEFYKRSDTKDKMNKFCKDCVRSRVRGGGAEESAPEDRNMTLDFKGFGELYDRIAERAAEETRTPEYQVYFWIKQGLGMV